MKQNQFIIASKPELSWEAPLPSSLDEFIQDNYEALLAHRTVLRRIFLRNDIKNIELVLKSKQANWYSGEKAAVARNCFLPSNITRDEINEFLSDPYRQRPKYIPVFIRDYLEEHEDIESRVANMDSLFLRYIYYLMNDEIPFFRYYGRMYGTFRTALAAFRIRSEGGNLEQELTGLPDVKDEILRNRNLPDFGLMYILPVVNDMHSLFESDRDEVSRQQELDRIFIKLFQDVGQESPFGDHVIYSYILEFLFRDRWNSMSAEKGSEILESIIRM